MHRELQWDKQSNILSLSARSWLGTFLGSYTAQVLISVTALISVCCC